MFSFGILGGGESVRRDNSAFHFYTNERLLRGRVGGGAPHSTAQYCTTPNRTKYDWVTHQRGKHESRMLTRSSKR